MHYKKTMKVKVKVKVKVKQLVQFLKEFD